MTPRRRTRRRWVFVIALLAGIAQTAGAAGPKAEKPPANDRSLERRQIMPRQIGFETQQKAYVAKVQGAASLNILWVNPEALPPARQGKSLSALLRAIFDSGE